MNLSALEKIPSHPRGLRFPNVEEKNHKENSTPKSQNSHPNSVHDLCWNFIPRYNFKFFFSARNSKIFVLGQAFARRYQIALVFGFVEKSGKDYYDSVIAIEGGSGDVEEIPKPQNRHLKTLNTKILNPKPSNSLRNPCWIRFLQRIVKRICTERMKRRFSQRAIAWEMCFWSTISRSRYSSAKKFSSQKPYIFCLILTKSFWFWRFRWRTKIKLIFFLMQVRTCALKGAEVVLCPSARFYGKKDTCLLNELKTNDEIDTILMFFWSNLFKRTPISTIVSKFQGLLFPCVVSRIICISRLQIGPALTKTTTSLACHVWEISNF